jgi:two-component system NtrC family sensor kinase
VLTVSEHQLRTVADVEVDLPPIPPVMGHGGEINQALYNIVRNAIEAVERRVAAEGGRGRIAIRTRPEAEAVHVVIEDSGCGIPPEIRGRIFEQFFTTKEVGRGTGLGLAVAWAVIVEKHGGQISFESTDAGTAFHVRLPWLARPQAA